MICIRSHGINYNLYSQLQVMEAINLYLKNRYKIVETVDDSRYIIST